jgi:Flp pilus assembly protein TadD, contains TPR repeats
MKIEFLCSTKRLEAEMRTLKYGLFILVVFMIVPITLLAQNKEVPITTSSKEALKYFMDGRDKLESGESPAEAISLFEKAIQKDPNFAKAYLYRAQSGGGYNVFRQNLDKAVSLIGKVSEGEKLEIQYSQASADGNGQKQKEYLDQLLKAFPTDKRVHQSAAWYYSSINDFDKAIVHFNKSIELDNKYAQAYNGLGIAQTALNNYPEAEKALQSYIKLKPDKPDPYDTYGYLLLKSGRYDESIVQYKKALERDPAYSFSLTGLGNNYIFKGDYESARKYYQDCFDKASDIDWKFNALFYKATSFVHEGKIENAITAFDEFRALAEKENLVPYAIWSYAYQGYVYSESGNPAEGMKFYDKAIDLLGKSKLPEADNESMITYSLAWHAYELLSNGELDKAMPELEKYKQKVESRMNPGEEMDLNSMFGLFETRKGNYDKALEYFAKANTESAMNWYYTALAYSKKGDKQNAFKLFDKIAKWNVNSLDLALVRKHAMEELKK